MIEKTFACLDCGQAEMIGGGISTGYAVYYDDDHNPLGKVCYDCCARRDLEWMRTHNKITLYLTSKDGQDYVTNWPGTLKFRVCAFTGKHNLAGTQTHAYFRLDDQWWIGRNVGTNNELCHCRKIKQAPAWMERYWNSSIYTLVAPKEAADGS